MVKAPRAHRAPEPYLALLGRITRIFHSSLNPKVILKLALVDTVKILHASSGSVVLINPDSGCLEIEASVGLSLRGRRLRLKPGEGITGWVATHGKPLRVDDVSKDARYIPARSNIRSELAVPLERVRGRHRLNSHAEENEVIGVLNVDSVEAAAFSQADEELLRTLAGQVSSLIQNAWLYDQARRRAAQLDALLKLGHKIMALETLPEVLEEIAQGASRLMNGTCADVLLLDSSRDHFKWRSSSDPVPFPKTSLAVEDTQLGAVIQRGKPVTVEDVQKSDPLLHVAVSHRRRVSLLAVPLIKGSQALGVLVLYRPAPHRFSNDEIQILSALANQSALAIQRCHLSEKLFMTEEALRQGERLSAIGLLAAEVAHEIRNPLTVIKMLTHSMEKEMKQDDPRRRDFEVLSRKMDEMNQSVERVLGWARSSEPVFEFLILNNILEDLALLIRHKVAQQGVQLKLTLGKDLPQARVDRAQIEQALLNVVLNALHAMPQGGSLNLGTGLLRNEIWIEVRDSGVGMSPSQKEKLFQPFLTSRPTGTGLGMAIVNKIVKAHAGEVTVRSRSKHGTSVRIHLPCVTPQTLPETTLGSP